MRHLPQDTSPQRSNEFIRALHSDVRSTIDAHRTERERERHQQQQRAQELRERLATFSDELRNQTESLLDGFRHERADLRRRQRAQLETFIDGLRQSDQHLAIPHTNTLQRGADSGTDSGPDSGPDSVVTREHPAADAKPPAAQMAPISPPTTDDEQSAPSTDASPTLVPNSSTNTIPGSTKIAHAHEASSAGDDRPVRYRRRRTG